MSKLSVADCTKVSLPIEFKRRVIWTNLNVSFMRLDQIFRCQCSAYTFISLVVNGVSNGQGHIKASSTDTERHLDIGKRRKKRGKPTWSGEQKKTNTLVMAVSIHGKVKKKKKKKKKKNQK